MSEGPNKINKDQRRGQRYTILIFMLSSRKSLFDTRNPYGSPPSDYYSFNTNFIVKKSKVMS